MGHPRAPRCSRRNPGAERPSTQTGQPSAGSRGRSRPNGRVQAAGRSAPWLTGEDTEASRRERRPPRAQRQPRGMSSELPGPPSRAVRDPGSLVLVCRVLPTPPPGLQQAQRATLPHVTRLSASLVPATSEQPEDEASCCPPQTPFLSRRFGLVLLCFRKRKESRINQKTFSLGGRGWPILYGNTMKNRRREATNKRGDTPPAFKGPVTAVCKPIRGVPPAVLTGKPMTRNRFLTGREGREPWRHTLTGLRRLLQAGSQPAGPGMQITALNPGKATGCAWHFHSAHPSRTLLRGR